MLNKGKKAQSINEYALVLGIIAVVLISMQTYFKRGINSLLCRTANEMGDIAETDWTKYYADRVNVNVELPHQTLGAMEQGMISYKLYTNKSGEIDFLESNTNRKFKYAENKKGSAVKAKKDYVADKTVFKGRWKSVYKFDSLGTFSSSEKEGE